ncbi:hypothetical protein ACWDBP_12260 [Streptomyces sp. NPDC001233]
MTHELVAVCDHCLDPVQDGDGVLEVDTDTADRALRAWKETDSSNYAVFHASAGTQPVKWTVRHYSCGKAPSFICEIAVERLRSWTALLDWSVHLSSKHWLAGTDWFDLIDRALHPQRAAVSGILPQTPRDTRRGSVGDLS